MEIRHIPSKVNPTDTITQQVEVEDAEYTGQVKRMDRELVDMIRISSTATDEEVQQKLDQLYSRGNEQEKSIRRTANFDRVERRAECSFGSVRQ